MMQFLLDLYWSDIESLPDSVRLLPLVNVEDLWFRWLQSSTPYQILITHDLIVSQYQNRTVLKPQFLIISAHSTTST